MRISDWSSDVCSSDLDLEISTSEAVSFPLHLRIPSWCEEAIVTLNGKELRRDKGGQVIAIDRRWENGDLIRLQLPMEVNTSNWGKNSRAVERGPLVYALKLEEIGRASSRERVCQLV